MNSISRNIGLNPFYDFVFLQLVEGSDSKTEESDKNSDTDLKLAPAAATNKTTEKKKKKKKPKSNKEHAPTSSGYKFVSSNIDDDDEERAIAEMLNENISLNESTSSKMFASTRKLFQIESKFLNSENEMIRMFGAKVVHGEKAK